MALFILCGVFTFQKSVCLAREKQIVSRKFFFVCVVLFPKQDLVEMLLLILAKRKILLVVVVVVVVRENLIVLTFFHVIWKKKSMRHIKTVLYLIVQLNWSEILIVSFRHS